MILAKDAVGIYHKQLEFMQPLLFCKNFLVFELVFCCSQPAIRTSLQDLSSQPLLQHTNVARKLSRLGLQLSDVSVKISLIMFAYLPKFSNTPPSQCTL